MCKCQIDEPELAPPPSPGRLEKEEMATEANVPTMTSTPLKADTPTSTTLPGNFTRPSAQVPPYSSMPTPAVHQGANHSVINVEEGTSVRQIMSKFYDRFTGCKLTFIFLFLDAHIKFSSNVYMWLK